LVWESGVSTAKWRELRGAALMAAEVSDDMLWEEGRDYSSSRLLSECGCFFWLGVLSRRW
jgi:hypothetical protein